VAQEEEEFALDSSVSLKNEDETLQTEKCPKVDTSDEKSVSSLSGVDRNSKSPANKSPARHK